MKLIKEKIIELQNDEVIAYISDGVVDKHLHTVNVLEDVLKIIDSELQDFTFIRVPKREKLSYIIDKLNNSKIFSKCINENYNNFWYKFEQRENGKIITWLRYNHEFKNEYYKIHNKNSGKNVPKIKILEDKIVNIRVGIYAKEYGWLYDLMRVGTIIEVDL